MLTTFSLNGCSKSEMLTKPGRNLLHPEAGCDKLKDVKKGHAE
jgi:hypothetical protein